VDSEKKAIEKIQMGQEREIRGKEKDEVHEQTSSLHDKKDV